MKKRTGKMTPIRSSRLEIEQHYSFLSIRQDKKSCIVFTYISNFTKIWN